MLAIFIVAARRVEVTLLAQQQLTAGQNVNMVGGPAALHPGPPLSIEGDPYLQRQNEPSMACSSRSAITCLAGANDYRLVSVPGTQADQVTGDAWLGVFWSHDDGQTWRSTALVGFPQDTSPAGLASPIHGFPATADPTIRAGTNGLFYYSGIAFNPAAGSGGPGKSGVMFVSLFIDDNNSQDVTAPPRYIRTVLTDNGTSGQFLDKPWIAADIPRSGAGTCTIPASNGVPAQVVPAGNVYAAYSVFTGSGNNANSKLLFTKSTNCGATWSNPIRLDASGRCQPVGDDQHQPGQRQHPRRVASLCHAEQQQPGANLRRAVDELRRVVRCRRSRSRASACRTRQRRSICPRSRILPCPTAR